MDDEQPLEYQEIFDHEPLNGKAMQLRGDIDQAIGVTVWLTSYSIPAFLAPGYGNIKPTILLPDIFGSDQIVYQTDWVIIDRRHRPHIIRNYDFQNRFRAVGDIRPPAWVEALRVEEEKN